MVKAKTKKTAGGEALATIGIIGGSGLYSMAGLKETREIRVKTPFGEPSDAIVVGTLEGKRVAFLARHGRGHGILPGEINFRANICAMKQLGVERIISVSAVGSLQEDLRPGEFLEADQFFDRTKIRFSTFFGGGLVETRFFVRSTNWSATRNSPGRRSSCNEPTALTEMMRSTPNCFIAQMFARKLISPGRMPCPRPCRAKKATRFPSSVPTTIASEGSPNGVFTRISRVSFSPAMEYNPLPPMIPIVANASPPAVFFVLAFTIYPLKQSRSRP